MSMAISRNVASAVIAALVVAAAVVGSAAPASADPPELSFVNLCGSVSLTWDTGTIGDTEDWATTVLRGSVLVEQFRMPSRGDREYGAIDGDVFEIRREGLPPRSFVHEAPEGCDSAPRLSVVASSDCTGLQLSFTNTGTTAVAGVQLLAGSPVPQDLAPIGVGSHTLTFSLADGTPFYVRGPGAGGGWLTWIVGAYDKPAACSTRTPTPAASASPPGGTLPVTGTAAGPVWGAGALLVAAGVVFLLVSRRRRPLQNG
ncbi:LPXTG cell wall anchor domain-containing protein [Catellatospora sichuanensis]|uniref:LPXTG cell wall anchor domain-containing protein n=1 Tax=Catellatospora sichuanensis TaxID=1969805 RepID=UPI00118238F1|nr:LPXTG cell wall anchor domain-containing protein [Catellatospora sichuanensis]